MRTGQLAAGVVGIAGIGVHAWMFVALPEVVASHFGPSGEHDAWMARGALIAMFVALQALFFAVAPLATTLVRRLPKELVNLPNKDYWLAPERRERAVERLGDHAWSFSAGMGAFLVFTEVLVLRANLAHAPLENGPFLAGLCAVFAFTIGWLVRMSAAFRLPPSA
jgi:hypothetical protein